MSTFNSNSLYEVTWYTDSQGRKTSIERINEQYIVVSNKIVLADLPDSYYKLQISSFVEIPLTSVIVNASQFKVNYDSGEVFFDSSLDGQTIIIDKYYGRGRIKLYGQNIKLTKENATYSSDNIEDFASETFNRIDNIVSNSGTSNTEIVDARNAPNFTYPTLKARLDDLVSDIDAGLFTDVVTEADVNGGGF